MLFKVTAKGETVFSDRRVSDLSQEWADVRERRLSFGNRNAEVHLILTDCPDQRSSPTTKLHPAFSSTETKRPRHQEQEPEWRKVF